LHSCTAVGPCCHCLIQVGLQGGTSTCSTTQVQILDSSAAM
jgi:hypothetical protein